MAFGTTEEQGLWRLQEFFQPLPLVSQGSYTNYLFSYDSVFLSKLGTIKKPTLWVILSLNIFFKKSSALAQCLAHSKGSVCSKSIFVYYMNTHIHSHNPYISTHNHSTFHRVLCLLILSIALLRYNAFF